MIKNKGKMLLVLFYVFSVSVLAQKSNNILGFDAASFNEKDQLAIWLCRYDNVAWVTSDSVSASPKDEMKKLGKEWFCYEENKVWHAVYGKYSGGIFNMVFHYVIDPTTQKIKRVYYMPIDTSMTGSFSRALINSDMRIKKYLDTNYVIRFNQYIRRDSNKSISVWLFPAFQENGTAAYGGEFYYKYDEKGNKLLDKQEYFQGKFRGFKTGNKRDISIDYTDTKQPTLGAVFFVRYYRDYFTNITIETKDFNSELYYDPTNGYSWITAVKDQSPDKK